MTCERLASGWASSTRSVGARERRARRPRAAARRRSSRRSAGAGSPAARPATTRSPAITPSSEQQVAELQAEAEAERHLPRRDREAADDHARPLAPPAAQQQEQRERDPAARQHVQVPALLEPPRRARERGARDGRGPRRRPELARQQVGPEEREREREQEQQVVADDRRVRAVSRSARPACSRSARRRTRGCRAAARTGCSGRSRAAASRARGRPRRPASSAAAGRRGRAGCPSRGAPRAARTGRRRAAQPPSATSTTSRPRICGEDRHQAAMRRQSLLGCPPRNWRTGALPPATVRSMISRNSLLAAGVVAAAALVPASAASAAQVAPDVKQLKVTPSTVQGAGRPATPSSCPAARS